MIVSECRGLYTMHLLLSVCPFVRQFVRPTVCLSVTRWYCVETAQPIVKLSSLPGSP